MGNRASGSSGRQRRLGPLVESGGASFYADSLEGNATASGEPYDPCILTCAHKTLPLGTWLDVMGEHGQVCVRVNDRGPYIRGRVVDLSREAAGRLEGMMEAGVVDVRLHLAGEECSEYSSEKR